MKLITKDDIERWGESHDAKGNFPYLICSLIRATSPISTKLRVPSGSAVYTSGWDGVVNCTEDRGYVPKGLSFWELGTGEDVKAKAESDYKKRTFGTHTGYNPIDSTFIFATTRFWGGKQDFINEKLKDGIWNDVRVYDSVNIEEWLEIANVVSRKFAYIGTHPSDGVKITEDFWEEWAMGPLGELPPSIVTAGREDEAKQLLEFLSGAPNIKAVQAPSKNEAIAFIIASAKQYEESDKEYFFSKTLIINTPANYTAYRKSKCHFNIIPTFDDVQILYAAVTAGHHVIVPLGPDDTFSQAPIELPSIDRDGQVKALVLMGISPDDAAVKSREAGRNITILKRLLGFPENKLEWVKPENVRDILPALLIGKWNENMKGDREIIEKLSGEKYDEYLIRLVRWRDTEDAPIIQIGNTWRLTSPMDAWAHLSPFLTKKDLDLLHECFMQAFKNGNPEIEPDPKLALPPFFTKEKTFSAWAREGLIQSLILIGLYGNRLKISNLSSQTQPWVDQIIHLLLFNANGEIWASLNHELPLIAEASPQSFIGAIQNSLSKDDKPITEMFTEREDLVFMPRSNHTGLLWALEGLSWMPEYLMNASLLLAKLSAIDPGGRLSNRPINSLTEIFKAWHYQTLASFDDRMRILKEIVAKEKEIGWTLLLRLLPVGKGEVAHPTSKMRWRMLDKSFHINYNYPEIIQTHSYIIDLMLLNFDFSEVKFSQLLVESANISLQPECRNKILDFAEKEYSKIKQTEYSAWHSLRKTISHHRSFPYMDWALPEAVLQRYENLYNRMNPADKIENTIWLFNEYWPSFIEGFDRKKIPTEKQQEIIEKRRREGLQNIYSEYGIEKIKELSLIVKEPWSLGAVLAKFLDDDTQIIKVFETLKYEGDNLRFINGFIHMKYVMNGLDYIILLYEKLSKSGLDNKTIAKLFLPVEQSKKLWDFIISTNKEITDQYWSKMNPMFYNLSTGEKIIGVNYLLEHKRFISAIHVFAQKDDKIPTELLVKILEKAAAEKANEDIQVNEYDVQQIFEVLEKKSDIEKNTLIRMEWMYLPFLDSYGNSRNTKAIYEALSENPQFFIDVLKWAFKPANKELEQEERMNLTDEMIRSRGLQAYQLLHSWKKVPGVAEDGKIDSAYLNNWVDTVRDLAGRIGRSEVADMQIGEILAQYPEKDPNYWPPNEICEIIQRINTKSICTHFSSATFNKRGSSSRGPFDGGQIEREHATYFERLAENHKMKFPAVASILHNLSVGYLADAERMDETAERDKLEY